MGQHVHQLLPGVQGFGFELAFDRHQRGQALRIAVQGQERHRHQRALDAALGIEADHAALVDRLGAQLAVQVLGVAGAAGRDQLAGIRIERGDRRGIDAEQGDGRVLEARFEREGVVDQDLLVQRQAWRRHGGRAGARGIGAQGFPGDEQQRRQRQQAQDHQARRTVQHAGAPGQQQHGQDRQQGAAFRCHACPACGTARRG